MPRGKRVLVLAANLGAVVMAVVAAGASVLTWFAAFMNQSTEYRMGVPMVAGIVWTATLVCMGACIVLARLSIVARPLRVVVATVAGFSFAVLFVTLVCE